MLPCLLFFSFSTLFLFLVLDDFSARIYLKKVFSIFNLLFICIIEANCFFVIAIIVIIFIVIILLLILSLLLFYFFNESFQTNYLLIFSMIAPLRSLLKMLFTFVSLYQPKLKLQLKLKLHTLTKIKLFASKPTDKKSISMFLLLKSQRQ